MARPFGVDTLSTVPKSARCEPFHPFRLTLAKFCMSGSIYVTSWQYAAHPFLPSGMMWSFRFVTHCFANDWDRWHHGNERRRVAPNNLFQNVSELEIHRGTEFSSRHPRAGGDPVMLIFYGVIFYGVIFIGIRF